MSTTTTDTTTDLILKIDLVTEAGYDGPRGTFEAAVYAAKAGAGYDDVPLGHLSAYQSPWAGFQIEARDGHPGLSDGRAYGFEYGFRPEGRLVTSRDVERYARGLKKVERAYDKLCAALGRPQSLGHQVVYLMHALGITQACWRLPNGRDGSGPHRGWKVTDEMESIRHHIDSAIETFRDTHLSATDAA
jgi:hypothetical protein